MGSVDVLLGMTGLTLIGSLGYGFIRYAGSSEDITSYIKNLFNRNQDINYEIDVTNKKQEIIVEQLKLSEKASEEAKQKIDGILKTAAIEVNSVLQEDKLSIIDSKLKEEWDE